MKKLLIFGGPIFQLPIIEKAKEMGVYVGVVDINNDAPAASLADEFFQNSIKDFDSCLEICRVFKPDGIMSGACDTSVVTVARLCDELKLSGNSVETAILATNKLKMIERFREANVEHPQFQVVQKKDINEKLPIWNSYPAICKPVDSSGSRGIYYLSNSDDYKKYVVLSSKAGVNGDVLIEEYMNGPEVSVEVIVCNGEPYVLQITDKITSGPPNFFETGHSQPSILDGKVKCQISNLAKRAVVSLGIKTGPVHVEIKLTETGPKMVELGARMGGDTITTYLINSSVTGVNMSELAIKAALGEINSEIYYSDSGTCSAIRFILAEKGILKSIEGIEEVEGCPAVINVTITGKIGNYYSGTNDNASRVGFVVAVGKSTEEALKTCENSINKIKLTYE